jgi:hypothetical protein
VCPSLPSLPPPPSRPAPPTDRPTNRPPTDRQPTGNRAAKGASVSIESSRPVARPPHRQGCISSSGVASAGRPIDASGRLESSVFYRGTGGARVRSSLGEPRGRTRRRQTDTVRATFPIIGGGTAAARSISLWISMKIFHHSRCFPIRARQYGAVKAALHYPYFLLYFFSGRPRSPLEG